MPHWLKLQEMTVCFLSYSQGALHNLLPSPLLLPGTFSCKNTWLSSHKNRFGFPYTRTDYSPYSHTPLRSPKKLRTLFLLQAHEDRWYLPSLFWENCKKITNINIKKKKKKQQPSLLLHSKCFIMLFKNTAFHYLLILFLLVELACLQTFIHMLRIFS